MEDFSDDDSFKSACSAVSLSPPHRYAPPCSSPRQSSSAHSANSVCGGGHNESSSLALAESVTSLSASVLFQSAHSNLDQCGGDNVVGACFSGAAAPPAHQDMTERDGKHLSVHESSIASTEQDDKLPHTKSKKSDTNSMVKMESTSSKDSSQSNNEVMQQAPWRERPLQIKQSKSHDDPNSWRLITSRTETSRPNVTSTSFNQDVTCVCIGTERGFRIRTILPPPSGSQTSSTTNMVHQCQIPAGVTLCHMLYGTSLLAIVKTSTPRTLSLVNAWTGESLRDLHFVASVKRVEMNRRILCALAADGGLHVFNLTNLQLIRSIGCNHPSDPARAIEGLNASTAGAFFAVSNVEDELFIVCRCRKRLGWVRVYKIIEQAGIRLAPIGAFDAHNHSIARIAIGGPKGKQTLATASEKGTVIRIFDLGSTFRKLGVLLRGSSLCSMHSIAFNSDATMVASSSSNCTVHVFLLEKANGGSDAPTKKEKDKLKFVRLLPEVVSDQKEGVRSWSKIRLKSTMTLHPLSLAFLPSNQLVVLTNHGTIQRFMFDTVGKAFKVASEDALLEDSNFAYNHRT